jgi:hypothetical protein
MQLHVARLCLDCQEIHDAHTCPVCGSESFAFLSRWVPAPERRTHPRPMPPHETADIYRQLLDSDRQGSGMTSWIKRGALGLVAVSIAGWVWTRREAAEREKGRPGRTPAGPETR